MKKRRINILIFIILAFCYPISISAQNASMQVTPPSFLIGDQALLTIQLKVNKNTPVVWPSFIDSTSAYKIEVVDYGVVDTLKSDTSKWITYTQKLKITTFDTGEVVLNPISFFQPDSLLIALTDSFRIQVSTIPVDTTKAFMDIQNIMSEPLHFSEILPWILLGIGILAILALGIYMYIRWKRKKSIFGFSTEKFLPAHEIALAELQKLKDKRLWQQGLTKEYYSELTDIIRQYIMQRYAIEAMEMLSSDILHELSKLTELNSFLSPMQKMLFMADMVKFAKENPLPNENDQFLSFAFEFVQNTALKDVPSNNVQPNN